MPDFVFRKIVVLSALAVLASCSGRDAQPVPASVSTDEARALDDAAQMLGERQPTDAPSEISSDLDAGA